jgi:hypothetical protein
MARWLGVGGGARVARRRGRGGGSDPLTDTLGHQPVPHSTPTGVIVLGMHRSGTSAATGLMNLLGLAPSVRGDLMMGTRTNAKGHWESRSMYVLNDRLLAETGHSWWYPPTLEELALWLAGGTAVTGESGRAAFDRVHLVEPWVWKDPRTCVTLSYWRRALDRPVAGVIVFRNPIDVARSLEQRDYISPTFGVALWMRYTRLLLEQAAGMPVLVSSYDDLVGDPQRWSTTVRAFLSELGMAVHPTVNERAVRRFVDPKLQHNNHSRDDLRSAFGDGASTALYDALHALAGSHASWVCPPLDPEPAWVQDELDAIGPEWPSQWKVPGSIPPTLPYRFRSLVRRLVPLGH